MSQLIQPHEMESIIEQLLSPMSNTELSEVIALNPLQANQRIDEMIKDLPIYQKLEQAKEILIATNKSLAEFNLSKQSKYTETRAKLVEAHENALLLQQQAREKQSRLSASQQQYTSPDVLRGLLQVAAQEAEEKSESLAERFVNGDIPYAQFLEEFLPLRTLSHARRVKYEKLTEEIRRNPQMLQPNPQQSSAASSASARPSSRTTPLPPYVPPTSYQPPYPTGSYPTNVPQHPVNYPYPPFK